MADTIENLKRKLKGEKAQAKILAYENNDL
jgi:hypothetical protein